MAKVPKPTVFLERATYRRRRLRDAGYLWPVFGVALIVFPMLWPQSSEHSTLTSSAIYYVFGVWAVLICGAFIIARVVPQPNEDTPDDTP